LITRSGRLALVGPATQQFHLAVLLSREVAVVILTEELEISRMNWWLAWLSTKLGFEGSVSLDWVTTTRTSYESCSSNNPTYNIKL